MSTKQDIYAASSETRPPMLNKENYVPWSSRLLRYAKSRPNGNLIYNSIVNGSYVERMIPEPCDQNREVEADDQAIQTILLGLPEDIYAAVDSCETAQEIWLRVQQMMKGSDIGIQEKKAKLFNEWERFTFTDRESIESYYHRFSKLMNDFKRNKHFPEKIASNLKNRVVQNAIQNSSIQNVGNPNGIIVVLGIANQNTNQNGNGNVVAAQAEVPVNETFHEQTDDELTEKELKQVEADNQAIQTILLGLPKDIYVVVDSCETTQETGYEFQQMMRRFRIDGISHQEKKAKVV
ncbi:hypothetical protein Tco_0287162 [Tanacetum coccineum]